jgi:N-acetyl sugar amidotransferase
MNLRRCAKCGLPQTYETLEFDEAGVCNICNNHKIKREIDWVAKKRQLDAIIEQYRGKHPYDCIVPFSGGKDSTFQLLYLMREYGVKPLVVQYDHGFFRPGLLANNERTFRKLGVEVHSFRANWHVVKRTMVEALIRRGDWCWSCHSGCFAYPMQAALRYETPLLVYGEPSAEHNAYYSYDDDEAVDEKRFDLFTNLGISADDMSGMIKHDTNFDFRDLNPFRYPKRSDLAKLGVRAICLGSYIKWDATAQTELIKKELGWEGADVEGMPSIYDYTKIECHFQGVRDYLKYLKRGYGRVTQMTAFDIRNGRMTKEEADALIKEYEGKRPASLDAFLELVEMTEEEFNDIVRNTVVYPNEPDFNRPRGVPNKDAHAWYRECSKSG